MMLKNKFHRFMLFDNVSNDASYHENIWWLWIRILLNVYKGWIAFDYVIRKGK